jgi:hypothetical protein
VKKKTKTNKSMGGGGGQTKREQNKQTNKHIKKNSRFRNNRISILVVTPSAFSPGVGI